MISKSDSAYILAWAKKIKAIRKLGGKCMNCDCDDIFCLEFHHRDSCTKTDTISNLRGTRWSDLDKELDKCNLLCKNCHANSHHDDGATDSRRAMIKIKLLEYKNIFSCQKCGYHGSSYRSLDFHHCNAGDKDFELNEEVWKVKRIRREGIEDRILREIDKCSVVCKNCHCRIHTNIGRFERMSGLILSKVDTYHEYGKLSSQDIIALYKGGMKRADIARHFDCAKSSITYILAKSQ